MAWANLWSHQSSPADINRYNHFSFFVPTPLKYKALGSVWLALTESHVQPWLRRAGTLIDSLRLHTGRKTKVSKSEIETLGRKWRDGCWVFRERNQGPNKSHLLTDHSSEFIYALISAWVPSDHSVLPTSRCCLAIFPALLSSSVA